MMGRWAQRFAMAIERPSLAYAASLCAVAAAGAVRAAVGLMATDPPDYMIFYPAILFATLIAGARGGLLATGASALLVWALWLDGPQYASLLTFVGTSAATVFIARAIRIAVLRGATAEERFRIFQEQSLDGFVIVEPVYDGASIVDFVWTYSNRAADRMTPAGVRTLKGSRILEVFPGENGQEIVKRLIDAFGSGGPDEVEARRLLDGEERYLRSSAMRVTGGLAVTFTDVTAQRQSENALRAGEARIRALVDSLPQLIWSTRADGFCDYFSPQWTAFTGSPAERHHGLGWLEAVHPEDRDGVQQAWSQAVRGGLPYDIEYRLRRHDGAWRWVNAKATAIHNEQGGVHRWFGTSSDI
ncbi:MAG: hybrid sensor histidine kinase/response regulator, partial [Phenylobacterium sp.]|nr:hybrid sensor histidine kinase/response regulator [Phenylobacterium sp.]